MTTGLDLLGRTRSRGRGAGGGQSSSWEDVTLDVADATLSDPSGLIASATTTAGVTSFSVNTAASACSRIDNGGAVFTWQITDMQGADLKRSLHHQTVHLVVEEVTPPTIGSDLCVGIGLRINGTTTWYTGGIQWDATRRAIWDRQANTVQGATNTNTRKVVTEIRNRAGQLTRCGATYDGSNGFLYDYDGTIADTANLTTKAELIVVVGYQAIPPGAQTCAVRLRWRRPLAWGTIAGLLS